ncbi:DNA polymerase III subunit gamma/tau [Alsobacter sp. SYSU M60028]|uniref:DNA polymerase III subunit gamma/tau n=1 Tax=Alsobacter ponti TaxID=2962936 RepID=A0ABT1L9H8_9HYPH|nr:DNA polymerase III subunit gamma/tau [Alsobacter ponti]MCP8938146.1 DNA polymerase III subunit gamma/tau [Alsobacter ponti]
MTDQPTLDHAAVSADTDGPGLPGLAPPQAASQGGYRVLARKYRPQNFDDLIGQEAMVRTLRNAFATGRIPQAWILTGVRGVGKTTTARILARGLNYVREDGSGGPTVELRDEGVHCRAIMESRHVDVLEMDAASHTSVEDVRAITDGIRYAPASARYKVYIIDEVHMLSEKAFNAFLKTLEEPPPHAKFVFATTEIRKVPVTILSRCQRFDLRRVDASLLVSHLESICRQEGVSVEPEALAMIARAAEGSVRDSLSLLDQAIAHGAGRVDAETVRAMMGLADRARVIDLFEAVMKGDIATALKELRDQYDSGADPAVVLTDLAEFVHLVTRLKVVPEAAREASVTEVERVRGEACTTLSMRVLSRAWQMLSRGIAEVQSSPKPVAAAEMVLVRLAYAADLPTPDDALRLLSQQGGVNGAGGGSGPAPGGGGGARAVANGAPRADQRADPGLGQPRVGASLSVASRAEPQARAPSQTPAGAPAVRVARFEDLVALAAEKRDIAAKMALERDVRLVRFEDGRLEFAAGENASPTLAGDLSKRLADWTGRRWIVALSSEEGQPTLREKADAEARERMTGVRADPLVRAALERWPGAQITAIRDMEAAAPAPAEPDEDAQVADAPFDFDGFDDDL